MSQFVFVIKRVLGLVDRHAGIQSFQFIIRTKENKKKNKSQNAFFEKWWQYLLSDYNVLFLRSLYIPSHSIRSHSVFSSFLYLLWAFFHLHHYHPFIFHLIWVLYLLLLSICFSPFSSAAASSYFSILLLPF